MNLHWRFSGASVEPLIRNLWVKGSERLLPSSQAAERFEAIRKALKTLLLPSIKVLELGSGHGYLSLRLAERLNGTFLMMEGHPELIKTALPVCYMNNNPQTFFLAHRFSLKSLAELLANEPCDVILALDILHYFEEPYQDVLDFLMRHTRLLILEHPHPYERSSPIRIPREPLNFSVYKVEYLARIRTKNPLEYRFRDLLALSSPHERPASSAGMTLGYFRKFNGVFPPIHPKWEKNRDGYSRIIRGRLTGASHSSKKR